MKNFFLFFRVFIAYYVVLFSSFAEEDCLNSPHYWLNGLIGVEEVLSPIQVREDKEVFRALETCLSVIRRNISDNSSLNDLLYADALFYYLTGNNENYIKILEKLSKIKNYSRLTAVNYRLGLNAYQNNEIEEAKEFLEKSIISEKRKIANHDPRLLSLVTLQYISEEISYHEFLNTWKKSEDICTLYMDYKKFAQIIEAHRKKNLFHIFQSDEIKQDESARILLFSLHERGILFNNSQMIENWQSELKNYSENGNKHAKRNLYFMLQNRKMLKKILTDTLKQEISNRFCL